MRCCLHPACLALALAVAACGSDEVQAPSAVSGFPLTLRSCDERVRFDAPPRRVLTIGTSAVYQMHAAGASDRIAARAGEFGSALVGDAGEAVKRVRVIDLEDPALEPIVASGVDTVIHYGLFKTTASDLRRVGINSIVTSGACAHAGGADEGADFEDVYRDVEQFGQLFGTRATATATVAELRRRTAAARRATAGRVARSAAAVHFFPGLPISASGNRSMSDELMTLAGLENVFNDLDEEYVEISAEQLVRRDPEVIVLAYGVAGESFAQARRKLLDLPAVNRLEAVRGGRIIGLPAHQRAPDVNAVAGLEELTQRVGELR